MGVNLNQDTKEAKRYKHCITELSSILYRRLVRPWLYCQRFYYSCVPWGWREKAVVSKLHHFTDTVIKKRSENLKFNYFSTMNENDQSYSKRKKIALLDLLLNSKVQDGLIDDQGIRDEVNTFMFEVSIILN